LSPETISGITFGLGAACCQSVSYLFSRRFVGRAQATPALLLVASHLLMGAASQGLRDARSAPVRPPAPPMPKAASIGLTFVAFGFLLVSMVPLELTSWMTLTDLCFVVDELPADLP